MTAGRIGLTTIELSWTVIFDENTPIIEAIIYYFIEGQMTQRVTVEGSTPTNVTLGSLMASRTYIITIFLRNAVGTSKPAFVVARTLGQLCLLCYSRVVTVWLIQDASIMWSS